MAAVPWQVLTMTSLENWQINPSHSEFTVSVAEQETSVTEISTEFLSTVYNRTLQSLRGQ
jgi:hypothetical protein